MVRRVSADRQTAEVAKMCDASVQVAVIHSVFAREPGSMRYVPIPAIQLSELRLEVDEAPHVNAFILHFDLRGALGATPSTNPDCYFGGTVQYIGEEESMDWSSALLCCRLSV